jgi:hypothetical protein
MGVKNPKIQLAITNALGRGVLVRFSKDWRPCARRHVEKKAAMPSGRSDLVAKSYHFQITNFISASRSSGWIQK